MITRSDLPEAFHPVFARLVEVRHPTRAAGEVFHQCFGCGPGHPSGLRVRCFGNGAEVMSPIVIAASYAGPPGAAHGGIVAAYLDEVLAGAVAHATGRVAVTGELTVRYVAPVPVARPLVGRGRLVQDHGRYLDVEGHLEDLESQRVLATARGRFFPLREQS